MLDVRSEYFEYVKASPSISRVSSQSTAGVVLGDGDKEIASPDLSPAPSINARSPFLQIGPGNKQWIDLDYISPKLLRELRRQYDPSSKDDELHPISKGAAKVKAWVRKGKLGIDIRLRHKINSYHDEVTDIRLVPDDMSLDPQLHLTQDDKSPGIGELPGSVNEIYELPDNSAAHELSAVPESFADPPPSGSRTGSLDIEPLPRYARYETLELGLSGSTTLPEGDGPSPNNVVHSPSSSESSIVTTPIRGLPVENSNQSVEVGSNDDFQLTNTDQKESPSEESKRTADAKSHAQALKKDLKKANQRLREERQVNERFQDILRTMKRQYSTSESTTSDAEISFPARNVLKGLKVTESSTYETETDVEPPSPSAGRRNRPTVRGKKSVTLPNRNRSGRRPVHAKSFDLENPVAATGSTTESLMRRRTIPKQTPASAGAEEIWQSLLRSQATILGPEHPLTYQAKSDLAHCRANGHRVGPKASLVALYESKAVAIKNLGLVHPLVSTFAAELETLSKLAGYIDNDGPNADAKARDNVEASKQMTDHSAAVSSSMTLEDSPSTIRQDLEEEQQTQPSNASMVSPRLAENKPKLPLITTTFHSSEEEAPIFSGNNSAVLKSNDSIWNTLRPPHKPRNEAMVLAGLVFAALTNTGIECLRWLQRTCGPEPAVEPGKVRVRWTCQCGEQMYDDFVERRVGAARELEAYLNRPRTHASGNTPTSPDSSQGNQSFAGNSFGGPPSTQTSWTSYSATGTDGNTKSPQSFAEGLPFYTPFNTTAEPPWLLTCANENRFTPKLAHLNVAAHRITSDKDLAMSLRDHYFNVNKKWWRTLRLRGLISIEFVQFEVHQNRFCDLRKVPDVPPQRMSDYTFEPGDLLPPVGSHYLLHLFKHPEDYDGELITYLRTPKKKGRLQLGVGWGINLVEGFEAAKVWLFTSAFFTLASLVFAVAWACKRDDVQGAFGVAAWICTLAVLLVGWLQAALG